MVEKHKIVAVIPCAGTGGRFPTARNPNNYVPKELVYLPDGKRLLEYNVENLYARGIRNFLFVLSPQKFYVFQKDFFPWMEKNLDGAIYDYVTQDLSEGKGLGYAVEKALASLDEHYNQALVVLGDNVYSSYDFIDELIKNHYESKADVSIVLSFKTKDQNPSKYGVARLQSPHQIYSKIIDLEEKPLNLSRFEEMIEGKEHYACVSGAYIFDAEKIYEGLKTTPLGKNNEKQITDAIAKLKEQNNKVYGYVLKNTQRYDVNDEETYLRLVRWYLEEISKKYPIKEGF